MTREEQQEHAIRIVATYLADDLEFCEVYEDEELQDAEEDWSAIYTFARQILEYVQVEVYNANPDTYWPEDYEEDE